MFKNNDVIVCSNNIKMNILKNLTEKKELINLKFYTLNEFKNILFGTYNEEAIYYLMKKYHYKYDVALTYLKNFKYNGLEQELLENNLIQKTKYKFSKVYFIGYNQIDPIILEGLDYEILDEKNDNLPTVYGFNNIEEEIDFVALKIIELLDTKDINDIFLVNVPPKYLTPLKKIFKFYNIPINLNEKTSIYGTKSVKEFLKNLDNNEIIIPENDIGKKILRIVNKYAFAPLDEIKKECIKEELKRTSKDVITYQNAVNIVDISDMKDGYYFILSFNEGIIPISYSDNDFLSDNKKEKLGLLTSTQKNHLEREMVMNKIKCSHVVITCDKEKKSNIIKRLNLEVQDGKNNYYSNVYNKIKLSQKLDKLIKYSDKDEDLDLLYSNYSDTDYLKYNNEFNGIDSNKLKKYYPKTYLSYSAMNEYNECCFKYYANRILKLNEKEDTFALLIGNLFHDVLSHMYDEDFAFEKTFNEFMNDKELDAREKYFVSKLKKDLLETIEVIKKQDLLTTFNNNLTEKGIVVENNNFNIVFNGKVDKIKYKEDNGKTYVVLVDYKTGDAKIDPDEYQYGIGMQLPVYLYLVRHSDLKNVEFVGFYLQEIIHSEINYEPNKDYQSLKEKAYRLAGYTVDDLKLIEQFDKDYEKSSVIKGMSITNAGNYNAYAKVISKNEIEELIKLVEDTIVNTGKNIQNGEFKINPKIIEKKIDSCKYCKFKDICFRKEKDIIRE